MRQHITIERWGAEFTLETSAFRACLVLSTLLVFCACIFNTRLAWEMMRFAGYSGAEWADIRWRIAAKLVALIAALCLRGLVKSLLLVMLATRIEKDRDDRRQRERAHRSERSWAWTQRRFARWKSWIALFLITGVLMTVSMCLASSATGAAILFSCVAITFYLWWYEPSTKVRLAPLPFINTEVG